MENRKRKSENMPPEITTGVMTPFPLKLAGKPDYANTDVSKNERKPDDAPPEISRLDGWLLWLGIKTMSPNSPKGIQWTAPNITLMLFILGGVLYVGIWYGTVTEQNRQRDAKIQELYQATNTAVQTAGDAKNLATMAAGGIDPTPTPKGKK